MNLKDFRQFANDTLSPHGIEIYVRAIDTRTSTRPQISQKGGVGVIVNQSFLDLPESEQRFGLLFEFLPGRQVSLFPDFLVGIFLGIFLVFVFASIPERVIPGVVLWGLVGPLIGFGLHHRKQIESRKLVNVLETALSAHNDPIAARTYLERCYGPVFPTSKIVSLMQKPDHPIKLYDRYGKDERLKAILRSDLVHPISSGSSHDPE